MAVAAVNDGGHFRVGSILYRAFPLYGANFVPFFAVTFVAAVPNLLVLLPFAGLGMSPPTKVLIAIEADLCLNTIGQAVILFGALQYLRGEPVLPGRALQRSLARVFPLLGLAILYSLGVLGGLLLLVVPGIVLAIMWAAALPACAVEGLGPIACMRRRARLTAGYRWKIFWIAALLIVVTVVVSEIIDLALRQAGVFVKASGSMIWAAAAGGYWNCVFAMIYHDLRVAKEGGDARQIAAIFD
jgi:hypothetical protein